MHQGAANSMTAPGGTNSSYATAPPPPHSVILPPWRSGSQFPHFFVHFNRCLTLVHLLAQVQQCCIVFMSGTEDPLLLSFICKTWVQLQNVSRNSQTRSSGGSTWNCSFVHCSFRRPRSGLSSCNLFASRNSKPSDGSIRFWLLPIQNHLKYCKNHLFLTVKEKGIQRFSEKLKLVLPRLSRTVPSPSSAHE